MSEQEKQKPGEVVVVGNQPLDNFMPVSLKDKYFLAEALVKSGIIPASINTPQKAMAILQMGHELGLSPMIALNNIAIVNGRATLGADLIVAIIMKHPDYAGMHIEGDDKKCTVTIRRKAGDVIDVFASTFTLADATRAGLTNKDSWKKYPQRMLKHRAISYAARDAFPDALAGVYIPEEMEDTPKVETKTVAAEVETKAVAAVETAFTGQTIETKAEPEGEVKGNYPKALDAIAKAVNEKALSGIEKMITRRTWTADEEKLLAIKIDSKRKEIAAKKSA